MKPLTADSLRLFICLVKDAPNWNGNPMIDISKEQRGNLTQLKRRGLLTTFVDEGIQWVSFTEKGAALAAEHGLSLR